MEDKIFNLVGTLFLDKDEAEAALALNTDAMSFAKFVFTDSKPNANNQRVPVEEFDNIIKSAIYMPLKMAEGEIGMGHGGSRPIGVIAQMKRQDDLLVGIAGLWKREFESEIKLLKEMIASGTLPQVSWELLYADTTKDDNEIEDLHGIVVKAATVVGMPAYKGRTPIMAIASEEDTTSLKTLEDQMEDELNQKIASLEAKVAELEKENQELKSYKEAAEKEKADVIKFASIKNKFKEAGIEKDDTYFEEKKDTLMKLGDEELSFMLQEMVAFSAASNNTVASIKVPKVVGDGNTKSPSDIVKALREHSKNRS